MSVPHGFALPLPLGRQIMGTVLGQLGATTRLVLLLLATAATLARPVEDRSTVTCADGSPCVSASQASGRHACCRPTTCAHQSKPAKTCVVRTERGSTSILPASAAVLTFDVPADLVAQPAGDSGLRARSLHRGSTVGADAERAPPLPVLLSVVPPRAPPAAVTSPV